MHSSVGFMPQVLIGLEVEAFSILAACKLRSKPMVSTLAELLAQKAALEQAIRTLQVEERTGAISKVKQLMTEHGLTLADLSTRSRTPKAPNATGDAKVTAKVAAKYRDSASGNSWSGRGLKPNWLTAALASGKKIEDFAV